MADNTALSVYNQGRMQKADRELQQGATDLRRAIYYLSAKQGAFFALALDALLPPSPVDHIHGAADSSTKQEISDISDLTNYLRKVVLNDGTVSTMTPAQARAIIDRYPG